MVLFNKKKKKMKSAELPKLPDLPELPRLEEFSENKRENFQLPKFPTSSFENKFSQDTKQAVSGKKEGDTEVFHADEFADEGMQKMPKPQFSRQEVPEHFVQVAKITRKTEPIFIRIDKFEQSLQAFEKIKKNIAEIKKMFEEVKELKEKEEKELSLWESEIQKMKQQIDRIDRDIFSKVQ